MTRRALLYECFSGISGDMHIGALIDVGVPAEHLQAQLARLELAHEFELLVGPGNKLGIGGTRATVALAEGIARPHRHLSDIRAIIDAAGYAPRVRDTALAIFEEIARAEAKIHDTDVEAVHFHEVGATDSIVDVVAAAVGLDLLDVDAIYCGPVELGGGMVRCAHGLLPVPAPATAEILLGVPTHYGRVDSEATTPTGAAILKTVVDRFEMPTGFVGRRIGYGIGQKDFPIPNALRVTLGEVAAAAPTLDVETNVLIDCNVDDMSPEAFAPLIERLLAEGARDVFMTAIVMKKSRPATKVSVLAAPEDARRLAEVLFAASTTIGVRTSEVTKLMLPRRSVQVATSFGPVTVKVATLPDGTTRWKSEHEDVLAIAADRGEDYLRVKHRLDAEIERHLADGTDP